MASSYLFRVNSSIFIDDSSNHMRHDEAHPTHACESEIIYFAATAWGACEA
jgi:hypothetical protein